MGMKEALEEVRLNLMAIDMNGDPGVDSFVNDSIEIIDEALKTETAQEVLVQEQYVGECKYCSTKNEVIPVKSIHPKFCMECGKPIPYQRIQLP